MLVPFAHSRKTATTCGFCDAYTRAIEGISPHVAEVSWRSAGKQGADYSPDARMNIHSGRSTPGAHTLVTL